MKINFSYFIIFSLLFLSCLFTGCSFDEDEDKNNDEDYEVIKQDYFNLTFDIVGNDHVAFGVEYANEILSRVPKYEFIVDSYLFDLKVAEDDYNLYLDRAEELSANLQSDYLDEINGMASVLCSATRDKAGDEKLSRRELLLINLIPDAARSSQCSAIGVFNSASTTGSLFVGRNLDWFAGFFNQLNRFHSIVTIRDGSKSICLIGYLGFLGAITIVNDNNMFACILDSETGDTYDSTGKYSYCHDLRYAMENYASINNVANYLIQSGRDYTYGNNIFICDASEAKVVENDLSDPSHRRIREPGSIIRSGVRSWPAAYSTNTIASVNSFILDGNLDNHYHDYNKNRWDTIIDKFDDFSPGLISPGDIKGIMTYYKGSMPGAMEDGDIFVNITQQIMIYHPATCNLEIHFNMSDDIMIPDSNTKFRDFTITF